MDGTLGKKTVAGILWSSLQKFGTMAISFVSNIFLARMLTPDDYGCIGMLMIFIAVANVFIDGGFGSALIQKKRPTPQDYSTIFYWNLILSVILYAVLYASAPSVAGFYGMPELSKVLRVQGVVLIFNAFSVIQNNQLRKRLEFKKTASINLVSMSLASVMAIVMAYRGFGLWSLVGQQLTYSLLNAVQLWIRSAWRPMPVFSRSSFRELSGFGAFILLSNLINTFCNNVQGLLIGKFFSPSVMGLYSQARKLEEVASTSISGVVDQVSYPVLAEVQDDRTRLAGATGRLVTSIAFFTLPLMFLLIAVAEPLITILYSDRWVECVPYFQVLCVAGMAVSLQNINYFAVAATGRSRALLVWTIVKRSLSIVFIVAGFAALGIKGLLAGMVLAAFTVYAVNAALVSKYVGYRIGRQIADLLPVAAVSAAAFAAAYVPVMCDMADILQLVASVALFAAVYLGISALLGLKAYRNVRELLPLLLKGKR
ncbi:MAG TPA: lipopolysaccharide biosynthesis protein [Candidatus Coprenecus pullistercoris]|nr:lipopolysaccharide biosynthesis protein [Candidatus Coprenecus pullistercoris]